MLWNNDSYKNVNIYNMEMEGKKILKKENVVHKV